MENLILLLIKSSRAGVGMEIDEAPLPAHEYNINLIEPSFITKEERIAFLIHQHDGGLKSLVLDMGNANEGKTIGIIGSNASLVGKAISQLVSSEGLVLGKIPAQHVCVSVKPSELDSFLAKLMFEERIKTPPILFIENLRFDLDDCLKLILPKINYFNKKIGKQNSFLPKTDRFKAFVKPRRTCFYRCRNK